MLIKRFRLYLGNPDGTRIWVQGYKNESKIVTYTSLRRKACLYLDLETYRELRSLLDRKVYYETITIPAHTPEK